MEAVATPPNMMRSKRVAIISWIGAGLAIALLIIFWVRQGHFEQTAGEIPIVPQQATVTLTPTGFFPAQLKISAGTQVTWVNSTSDSQAVGAAPYPVHSTLPQLASGALKAHGSYSFVFSQPGMWAYQDDSNPLIHGSIVVSQ